MISKIHLTSTDSKIRLVFFMLLVFFVLVRLHAVAVDRHLFGDGSVFFLNVVHGNAPDKPWFVFHDDKHMRYFMNAVDQAPLVLALKAGVTDVMTLRAVYGLSLFFMSMLGWGLAIWLLWRQAWGWWAWLPLAHYFLLGVLSEIFILNQAIQAMGWFWVLLALAFRHTKAAPIDWLLLSLAGFLSFQAHENILLCGMAIALVAFIHARQNKDNRLFLGSVGIVSLAAALFALYWQITMPVDTQTGDYSHTVMKFLSPSRWFKPPLSFSVFLSLVAVYSLYAYQTHPKRVYAVLKTVAGLLLAQLIIYQSIDKIRPFFEFQCRTLLTLGTPVVWLGLGYAAWRGHKPDKTLLRPLACCVLALGFLQVSWQLANNLRWLEFRDRIQGAMANSNQTYIHPREAGLADAAQQPNNAYHEFVWNWPMLGIALTDSGSVTHILLPMDLEELYHFEAGKIPVLAFSKLDKSPVFSYHLKDSWHGTP
jgi:hypothetical protein